MRAWRDLIARPRPKRPVSRLREVSAMTKALGRIGVFAPYLPLVCLLAATTPSAAQSAPPAPNMGFGGADEPGAPRSMEFAARALIEEGYALQAPIVQAGPNYYALVERNAQISCLMLDSFNLTVLQRFARTSHGYVAQNQGAPGPGFSNFPVFADNRTAEPCPTDGVVAAEAPIATPQPPKLRSRRRPAPVKRHRTIRPRCNPKAAGTSAPPSNVPPSSAHNLRAASTIEAKPAALSCARPSVSS